MRQSLISSADTCLKRVEFNMFYDFPYAGGVLRARGTGYHAGLAYYYAERQNTGLMPEITEDFIEKCVHVGQSAFDDELELTRDGWTSHIEDPTTGKTIPNPLPDPFSWMYQAKNYRADLILWTREQALEWIQQAITDYLENEWFWPAHFQVIGIEQGFSLPLVGADPEWARTGTVDLLLFDTETGWYVIVDHKTAKKKWAKNKSNANESPQAAYYVGAWQEILGTKAIKFVYDVYSDDRQFERRDAYRTEVQIKLTQHMARDLAVLIDKGGPFLPNPSSFLCSENWCDYWDACEYGKAMH